MRGQYWSITSIFKPSINLPLLDLIFQFRVLKKNRKLSLELLLNIEDRMKDIVNLLKSSKNHLCFPVERKGAGVID